VRWLYYKLPKSVQTAIRAARTLASQRILARRLIFSAPNAAQQNPPLSESSHLVNPLITIARDFRPSKSGHNYLAAYWKHLGPIREKSQVVVEIGVQTDRSVKMWKEFFPNATIFGFDIDEKCTEFIDNRIQLIIGDQSQKGDLQKLLDKTGPIDVVIDDGSHVPNHQIKTLEFLFPHLRPWGVYAIEDTGGVVGDYGLKTILRVSRIIQDINYWPAKYAPPDWPKVTEFDTNASWAARNTYGVSFYPRLVILERGKNPAASI
jgi:hypothetical protein